MRDKMPKLQIGHLVADMPIIQGGMGIGISLANLASAVANEGGIGVISASALSLLETNKKEDYVISNRIALEKEIAKARRMTRGIIGVNILMVATDSESLIETAVEAKVDIVIFGAGLLKNLPASISMDLASLPTKFIPIVSSARSAKFTFKLWKKKYQHVPDAVILEGPLAGGHLGFKKEQIDDPNYSLESILPEVLFLIAQYEQEFNKQIPVIVAGGIYTGTDIHRFLKLGAQGVQMATRFVATHECDASLEFKKAFVECQEKDLTIIDSPVGLPGRAIINQFLKDVAEGKRKPFNCPWKCLKTCKGVNEAPYCITSALINAKRGKFENGFVFAGTNAFRIDKILSVKELIEELVQEYIAAEN